MSDSFADPSVRLEILQVQLGGFQYIGLELGTCSSLADAALKTRDLHHDDSVLGLFDHDSVSHKAIPLLNLPMMLLPRHVL
jgi:hypothetical protein